MARRFSRNLQRKMTGEDDFQVTYVQPGAVVSKSTEFDMFVSHRVTKGEKFGEQAANRAPLSSNTEPPKNRNNGKPAKVFPRAKSMLLRPAPRPTPEKRAPKDSLLRRGSQYFMKTIIRRGPKEDA